MSKLGDIVIVTEPKNTNWGVYIFHDIVPGEYHDQHIYLIYGDDRILYYMARANLGLLSMYLRGLM